MISQVRSFAIHAAWVDTYVGRYIAEISITENKKIRRLATKHRTALLILSLYVLRVLQNNIIHVPGVYQTRGAEAASYYIIFLLTTRMGLIET